MTTQPAPSEHFYMMRNAGSRQIGPPAIFLAANLAPANLAPEKCWCGKLGPWNVGPQSQKYTKIILLVVSSQVLDRMVI